jgi:hypothetical protein
MSVVPGDPIEDELGLVLGVNQIDHLDLREFLHEEQPDPLVDEHLFMGDGSFFNQECSSSTGESPRENYEALPL